MHSQLSVSSSPEFEARRRNTRIRMGATGALELFAEAPISTGPVELSLAAVEFQSMGVIRDIETYIVDEEEVTSSSFIASAAYVVEVQDILPEDMNAFFGALAGAQVQFEVSAVDMWASWDARTLVVQWEFYHLSVNLEHSLILQRVPRFMRLYDVCTEFHEAKPADHWFDVKLQGQWTKLVNTATLRARYEVTVVALQGATQMRSVGYPLSLSPSAGSVTTELFHRLRAERVRDFPDFPVLGGNEMAALLFDGARIMQQLAVQQDGGLRFADVIMGASGEVVLMSHDSETFSAVQQVDEYLRALRDYHTWHRQSHGQSPSKLLRGSLQKNLKMTLLPFTEGPEPVLSESASGFLSPALPARTVVDFPLQASSHQVMACLPTLPVSDSSAIAVSQTHFTSTVHNARETLQDCTSLRNMQVQVVNGSRGGHTRAETAPVDVRGADMVPMCPPHPQGCNVTNEPGEPLGSRAKNDTRFGSSRHESANHLLHEPAVCMSDSLNHSSNAHASNDLLELSGSERSGSIESMVHASVLLATHRVEQSVRTDLLASEHTEEGRGGACEHSEEGGGGACGDDTVDAAEQGSATIAHSQEA